MFIRDAIINIKYKCNIMTSTQNKSDGWRVQNSKKKTQTKPQFNKPTTQNTQNKPSYNNKQPTPTQTTSNQQSTILKPLIITPEDIIWFPRSEQPEDIYWNKERLQSMLDAQRKFNEHLFEKNFVISQEVKDKLKKLQNDITEFHTSTCDVCGNKQSRSTHMNIEHITMKTSWGYESHFDGSSHSLTMCCDCYDKHIMDGPLGKFVKVTDYM